MHKKHQKAFTLVELLLSLAIFGMLMAAVAVAFDASIKNYQDNQGIYRTVNTARQTLLRLTNDIRTADKDSVSVDEDDDYLDLTMSHTINNSIQTKTYRFDKTRKNLYLNTGDSEYLMLGIVNDNKPQNRVIVDDLKITPGHVNGEIRNVRIVMTVTDPDSGVSQTLAAAAVVRRNL